MEHIKMVDYKEKEMIKPIEQPEAVEEQKFSLLGIEMPFDEFDYLMCEQSQGKELKVKDGKVVAEYHVPTEEELNEQRRYELKAELEKIKEDIEQENFGLIRDDFAEKKARAAEIINELRVLEGKQPREVKVL